MLGGQFAVTSGSSALPHRPVRRISKVNRPQREAHKNRNIEPTKVLFLSLCASTQWRQLCATVVSC